MLTHNACKITAGRLGTIFHTLFHCGGFEIGNEALWVWQLFFCCSCCCCWCCCYDCSYVSYRRWQNVCIPLRSRVNKYVKTGVLNSNLWCNLRLETGVSSNVICVYFIFSCHWKWYIDGQITAWMIPLNESFSFSLTFIFLVSNIFWHFEGMFWYFKFLFRKYAM